MKRSRKAKAADRGIIVRMNEEEFSNLRSILEKRKDSMFASKDEKRFIRKVLMRMEKSYCRFLEEFAPDTKEGGFLV